MEQLKPAQAWQNFKIAYQYKKRLLDSQKEDTEFALGKQWEDDDVETLRAVGVRALTINKINPIIKLLTGIESQNRTDFKAYPEGEEDSISGEIVTILLKNTIKNCMGEYKVSEVFKDGLECGECHLLPWPDYTNNLLTARLNLRKTHYYQVFADPDSIEYDLSDCKYICTVAYDLTEEELLRLFPDKETEIKNLKTDGKINIDVIGRIDTDQFGAEIQRHNYNDSTAIDNQPWDQRRYDLLAYDYKYYVKKYFVADARAGQIKEAASKEEANNYLAAVKELDPKAADQVQILEKYVPEIWCAYLVGGSNEFLEIGQSWAYPKYPGYPIVPFYCDRATTRVQKGSSELKVQGIVRKIKDLNREYNKRRTQELRMLNSSANSGWLSEEGSWVDPDKVAKFGSSPGIDLNYKTGKPKPEKILPTPLSQGHAQLAAENAQDLKDVPGINTDLLAMQEGGTDSGRAIALRQKQGMVMIQKIFDNLSQTKKILGKFIISMLSEFYTVENVIRLLGNSFIQKNFSVPVMSTMVDPRTGQPVQVPQIDPITGQPVMQVDQQALVQTINNVLNDPDLANYDIAVGESASNDTVRMANYDTLLGMLQQGIPVPPEIIIDASLTSEANKKEIKSALTAAKQMQAQAASPKK
jgi:hypothetical protein